MDSKVKINIIVIAKANSDKDTAFYELLLKHDSYMRNKANVYMVSSVDDFANLINNLKSDFSFILFIHKGNRASNPSSDGNSIVKSLKKLSYYNKLTYYMLSRDAIGEDVDAMDFLDEEYKYDQFTLNNVGLLFGITEKTKEFTQSEKFDFAILTALYQDEHKAFDLHMKTTKVGGEKNLKTGTFLSSNFVSDYNNKILLAWQQDMGMVDAAAFSSRLITKYNPKYLIMGGVCGGREGDVKLYDVIIPRNIQDYMSGKFQKGRFKPRPLRAEPSQELVDFLETEKDRIKRGMHDLASNGMKKIIDAGFDIHFKNYACGPWVVKTTGKLLQIAKRTDDDIIGLEMESLGVIRASKLFSKHNQYGLVVKSVMDFTDENKKDGDKGTIKATAAEMSYLCVRAILPILLEFKDPKDTK